MISQISKIAMGYAAVIAVHDEEAGPFGAGGLTLRDKAAWQVKERESRHMPRDYLNAEFAPQSVKLHPKINEPKLSSDVQVGFLYGFFRLPFCAFPFFCAMWQPPHQLDLKEVPLRLFIETLQSYVRMIVVSYSVLSVSCSLYSRGNRLSMFSPLPVFSPPPGGEWGASIFSTCPSIVLFCGRPSNLRPGNRSSCGASSFYLFCGARGRADPGIHDLLQGYRHKERIAQQISFPEPPRFLAEPETPF